MSTTDKKPFIKLLFEAHKGNVLKRKLQEGLKKVAEAEYRKNAAASSAKVDAEATKPMKRPTASEATKNKLKIKTSGYTSMYQGTGRNLV